MLKILAEVIIQFHLSVFAIQNGPGDRQACAGCDRLFWLSRRESALNLPEANFIAPKKRQRKYIQPLFDIVSYFFHLLSLRFFTALAKRFPCHSAHK